MASVNKVILVGNLGRDPEMRTFPSGDQVANVTIATTDKWRDKTSGENREATEWHRVVFNGRLAEIAGQYLRKGSQVYVEGSIRTRKWTDPQSGQDRYATEIRADTLQMLGGRSQQQGDGGNSGYGSKTRYRQPDATTQLAQADSTRFTLDCTAQPQWAVTPGQSAVLYDGEVCLGGGIITAMA